MARELHPYFKGRPTQYVAWRLGLLLITALIISLALYGLTGIVKGWGQSAISISVLFGIPYFLGAWLMVLTDPKGRRRRRDYALFPIYLIAAVLVLGGIILREGVICMIILAPLWWLAGWGGALTVWAFHKRYKLSYPDEDTGSIFSSSWLALVPLIALLADGALPQKTEYRDVVRSITIDAPVEVVWPTIHKIEGIQDKDGRWNFTQNLLGVPRPKSAIVRGEGIGAVRTTRWGDMIQFEEHISETRPLEKLYWDYVFADDSLQQHTDKHISPDGEHLTIESGGYTLQRLGANQTRLTLTTHYRMTTPVNSYSAMWGEFILGDIQNNVLAVVRTHAESKID